MRMDDSKDLLKWRDQLSKLMFAYGAIVFPLSMIYILPVFIAERRYALIALDAGCWLFMLSQVFFSRSHSRVRRHLALGVLYAMTVTFIVSLGPFHARPAWLVVCTVFAAVLFGVRGAIAAALLDAAILWALRGLMEPGNKVWASVYAESMVNWSIFVFNTSLLALAGGLAVGFLLNRLDWSLRYLLDAAKKLREHSEELKKAYVLLQGEMEQRKIAEKALIQSEAQYRLLAENATDVIWTADMELNVTYISPSAYRTRGYTRQEIMAMKLTDHFAPNSVAFATRVFAEELAVEAQEDRDLKRTRTIELEVLRKGGSTYWSEVNLTFIRDAEGKAVGILGVSRDVTDRKRAEKERGELQEQLRQAQKMEAIGTLAGGIAHDFNNLLTIMKVRSQLSLQEVSEQEPLRNNLEEIDKAVNQASDLTHQLLAFSRRQVLEMKVMDLNGIIRSLNRMLRRVIGEDIELKMGLADDLGRVKGDPGQIGQVIFNLAVNARDAMPQGGMLAIDTLNVDLDEVYAQSHVSVIPGRYVMVAVTDTGVGMTPAVKDRIFEPFFTTKEMGKGTGLGLSTVYGIVKQCGGYIWVYSEPGHGTTFRIYFPLVEGAPEEMKEKGLEKAIIEGQETILVVEDDKEVRSLAIQILEKQGYRVLDGGQGLEALTFCEKYDEPIQLILTDVVMPGSSGPELVRRIRSVRQDFQVLYMSGYTNEAFVQHGLLEKGEKILQKPFTMETLSRTVREVLDRRSWAPVK